MKEADASTEILLYDGVRLTDAYLESLIRESTYHHPEGTNVVTCYLILVNEFVVVGESACISSKEFDLALGKELAYENAIDKLRSFEGYLLREMIFQERLRKSRSE